MLARVAVNGLIGPAVVVQVGLAIPGQVGAAQPNRTVDRLLKDSARPVLLVGVGCLKDRTNL